MKRKPPVTNDKQHHVRISQRSYERLIEILRVTAVRSRRELLDNMIRSSSVDLDCEPMLEKRWRKAANRKKASRARRAER